MSQKSFHNYTSISTSLRDDIDDLCRGEFHERLILNEELSLLRLIASDAIRVWESAKNHLDQVLQGTKPGDLCDAEEWLEICAHKLSSAIKDVIRESERVAKVESILFNELKKENIQESNKGISHDLQAMLSLIPSVPDVISDVHAALDVGEDSISSHSFSQLNFDSFCATINVLSPDVGDVAETFVCGDFNDLCQSSPSVLNIEDNNTEYCII